MNRIQGKFNNNVKLIEDLIQENRKYEKEIAEIGGWKKVVSQNQAEWKKTFPCEAPTQYEIEDREIRMKAQGYKMDGNGKWIMDPKRKELNEIITQEINNNLR